MSRILMVASEATPFAKTGGLADVIGSLPAALAAGGDEVAVVLPRYQSASTHTADAKRVYDDAGVWLGSTHYPVTVYQKDDRGVRFFLLDCPPLYDRPGLYGELNIDYPDNHVRFAVLCRSALEVMRRMFRPDVVHIHDWQASLVAPMMKHTSFTDPTFMGVKILLTIHNLGYQGLFPRTVLPQMGMDPALFHPSAMEFYGQVNLLKGGIVFADAISTVSPTYAQEIQTPELGFGLDGLLRSRSNVISGILNGVDYDDWSPEVDPFIASHFTAEDLSGKAVCKRDLLREFGLPEKLDRPVIGIVSRFAIQKGFDLIEQIGDALALEDAALIVLGTGEPRYEDLFRRLATTYPDKVGARIAYDNAIAHKIEAGSDIFLMPSRYEPCGLNQIYSLRYGTVPVVRATGGLDDTIDSGTGFKFHDYSGLALLATIRQALTAYKDRTLWRSLMRTGMTRDYSWNASAAEYRRLYRSLVK